LLFTLVVCIVIRKTKKLSWHALLVTRGLLAHK
jgi:hypothetical protein